MEIRPPSADKLLAIIRQLVNELHPGRSASLSLTLDSRLDKDLGIDSLSRVELLQRLERGFAVRLPEQTFAMVESPRDLLNAVLVANESFQGLAAARVIVEAAGGKICKIDGSDFQLNEYLDGQRINEHLLISATENLSQVRGFLKPQ